MDDEAAAQYLREFIADVDRYKQVALGASRAMGGSSERAREQAMKDDLDQRLAVVQRIVQEVEPGKYPMWLGSATGYRYEPAREHANRALGLLEKRAEVDALFAATGPKLLAARLHPVVWNAAASAWDLGHRRDAIQRAATDVESVTQRKISRPDVGGVDLWDQAFSKDPPKKGARLRFMQYQPPSLDWDNAHEGARFFGRGCAMRIRNLVTHSTDEPAEQVALEQLAALSVLARWVDDADLEVPPTP